MCFPEFCDHNSISDEFSTVKVPQQNGVIERINRTLQETASIMINECDLPKYFWVEMVNMAC